MESALLDKYDQAAIVGLLIRLVRIQSARERDRALRAEIDARLIESNQQIALLNRAFGAFGFDTSEKGAWDRVREGIGTEAFKSAFLIARGEIEDEPARVTHESAAVDDLSSTAGETKPADQQAPRISEMILEFLQTRGKEGARVGDIKEYIRKTYGIETHEKTPGMTLFRLQKQDRVTRHGRIWFFVPAENGEARNPGVVAPGPINPRT